MAVETRDRSVAMAITLNTAGCRLGDNVRAYAQVTGENLVMVRVVAPDSVEESKPTSGKGVAGPYYGVVPELAKLANDRAKLLESLRKNVQQQPSGVDTDYAKAGAPGGYEIPEGIAKQLAQAPDNAVGPTVAFTLQERGQRYGLFEDHAGIACLLIDDMQGQDSWQDLPPYMQQALRVIADKIARMLNGDPYYVDNWHDIQGYAKLVEDIIIKQGKQ